MDKVERVLMDIGFVFLFIIFLLFDTNEPVQQINYTELKMRIAKITNVIRNKGSYFCIAEKLNVRSNSNVESEIIGTFRRYEKIDVYEIKNDWAKIEYKNDYAYVYSKYILPSSASEEEN